MLPIKTILHPTDFSAESESAFRLACDLASDYGASLVIMHVVSAPALPGDGVIMPNVTECQGELRRKLRDLEVPDKGVEVVRHLEEGNPATEILQMGLLCKADLIVMGTHGRSGLKRLMMGSVTEQVLRRSRCPVLTVAAAMAPRAPAEIPGLQHAEVS